MIDREPIRVLIADDHPIYRFGLRAMLDTRAEVELIGEAATGLEAVAKALELQPDVILMDLNMPELPGIDATRAILGAAPAIGILVLTMLEDDESILAAIRAGARGYVLKGAGGDDIVRAIVAVAAGEVIAGASIANRLMGVIAEPNRAQRGAHDAFPGLTAREFEVLRLLASGYTNTVIADRLFMSPKTVRNHVSSIFSKLEVNDRSEAIVRAREAGLHLSS